MAPSHWVAKVKPAWQDARPTEPGLRDAYAIAGKHVAGFSRAFNEFVTSLMTPAVVKEIRRLYASGAPVESIVRAIPWPNPAKPETMTAWETYVTRLESAYTKVLRASAEDARKRLPEQIEKLKTKPGKEKTSPAPRKVTTVPVNPESIRWAKERGAQLVTSISEQGRASIRSVVAASIARGERAETMVKAIKRSIGLGPREIAAMERFREGLLEAGASDRTADDAADNYADSARETRAKRIARTETIAAQNQGLLATWQEYERAGVLEGVERVWISAPESPNPARPCESCLEMDGKAVGINDPFSSAILGIDVMTPPLHPNCRCTVVLRRKDKGREL